MNSEEHPNSPSPDEPAKIEREDALFEEEAMEGRFHDLADDEIEHPSPISKFLRVIIWIGAGPLYAWLYGLAFRHFPSLESSLGNGLLPLAICALPFFMLFGFLEVSLKPKPNKFYGGSDRVDWLGDALIFTLLQYLISPIILSTVMIGSFLPKGPPESLLLPTSPTGIEWPHE